MKYRVKDNDTLTKIARKYLYDSSRWMEIWEINKTILKSGDPDKIYPGEIIIIPDDNKPVIPDLFNYNLHNEKPVNDEVTLTINGTDFTGWENVEITKAINAIAGSFSVSVSSELKEQINEGDYVIVKIGGVSVCNGFIDDIDRSLSASSTGMTISGRDKTADLVDCPVTARPGEWNNSTLRMILNDLYSPYSMKIIMDEKYNYDIEKFAVEPGETYFEVTERYLKKFGLSASCDGNGNPVIWKSLDSKYNFSLKEGFNILSGTSNVSLVNRFGEYIAESQTKDNTSIRAVVKDNDITRKRPFLLICENSEDMEGALKLVNFELKTRKGKSKTASLTVQNWINPHGFLWSTNKIIYCESPTLKLKEEMLITDVNFRKSNSGTITKLKLELPEAYAA